MGLAALGFARLIRNGEMRVTSQGQRADYWLQRLRCALEISGTRRSREVPRRHQAKVKQLLANPRRWGGYVFLACSEAGRPFIRWSYHAREG